MFRQIVICKWRRKTSKIQLWAIEGLSTLLRYSSLHNEPRQFFCFSNRRKIIIHKHCRALIVPDSNKAQIPIVCNQIGITSEYKLHKSLWLHNLLRLEDLHFLLNRLRWFLVMCDHFAVRRWSWTLENKFRTLRGGPTDDWDWLSHDNLSLLVQIVLNQRNVIIFHRRLSLCLRSTNKPRRVSAWIWANIVGLWLEHGSETLYGAVNLI